MFGRIGRILGFFKKRLVTPTYCGGIERKHCYHQKENEYHNYEVAGCKDGERVFSTKYQCCNCGEFKWKKWDGGW